LHAISDAPVKNDRNDALMLAKLLHANIVPTSYVPPKHIRELRDLVRAYTRLIDQRTQAKNRIRSVLMQHRLKWPSKDIASKYARIWLAEQQLDLGMRGVINANLGVIDLLKTELQRISQAMLDWKHCQKELELLQTISGFGPLVSRVFISEVGEITRFPDAKKLACYAGLVPGLHASGDKSRTGRLIKQSNAAIRRALVLAAWAAIRHDKPLRARYERLKARGKPAQKAIIAIARRLLCVAHVMLTKQTTYEFAREKLRARDSPASP
jgi:transposase